MDEVEDPQAWLRLDQLFVTSLHEQYDVLAVPIRNSLSAKNSRSNFVVWGESILLEEMGQ